MTIPETRLEHTLEALLGTAVAAPESRAELRAARAAFERAGPEADLARRRADEWFLLERHNQALGGVPIELALHGNLELEDADDEILAALLSSITGVFEVTGVQVGEGAWVRDLLAFGEYPLEEPTGSQALAHGDLLVGRLFPVGDGLHRVSRAAGVFRNPVLKEALVRDLEQARAARRGVLRLASPELERMFWGPLPADDEGRCAAAARAVLVRGGLGGAEVEAIFARLAAAPFDGRPLPGAADVLGDVLAELAFDTQVDLEAARTTLLALWPHLCRELEPDPAGDAPAETAKGAPDARAAMEAFDRGRRAGRDLEELFAELARDLGLELDESEDEQPEESPAPDFPGVVGALVEEYLWELQREQGPAAAAEQAGLRKLSVFAEPLGLIEELGARELLSFAAVWLPQWGELGGADEARAVLGALRAFCDWAQAGQEIPLRSAYDESVSALEDSLPRIAEANRARTAHAPADTGRWLVVAEVEGRSVAFQDGRGELESHALPHGLARHLRPGDLVRADTAAGELAVFCVYPEAASALAHPARSSD